MALLKDVLGFMPKCEDGDTFLTPVQIATSCGIFEKYEKMSDAENDEYWFSEVEQQEFMNDTSCNLALVFVKTDSLASKVMNWIRLWKNENFRRTVVIGVSGGKDSTICLKLCCEVFGAENVVPVLMPNGVQTDISDSIEICEIMGVTPIEVNIHETYLAELKALGLTEEDAPYGVKTNLPARLRMTVLYSLAACYEDACVVNTCNRSEDYVGYSTKYGDSAGDFSPLAGLTVREVLALGDELRLPGRFVHKIPSDGMCGKTDEDNLGFTYETLDAYLLDGIKPEDAVLEKIERLHRMNEHKLKPIPFYKRED